MLDALSLDQLRIFVAAADERSFSAAGRRLKRAQSVISATIANLEDQLGLKLFARSGRLPVLTAEGESLLENARRIIGDAEAMKARARDLAGGFEPELSVVVDVMFPQKTLSDALRAFAEVFPQTSLNLQVEALGAVPQAVLDQRCRVGVMGSLPLLPAALQAEPLFVVPFVTVAGPGSPMSQLKSPIPQDVASQHTQLVLSDRSSMTDGRDFGVIAARTWRLSDLGAKYALLREGLGWGNMPLSSVQEDLERGSLVEIEVEGSPVRLARMSMQAVWRKDLPPGAAGRWLISWLRDATV
jgi:DNA-binding transcriptional LysR family regulator